MAYFLNNINEVNQFSKTTKEKYFVDKSELIEKMNELVGNRIPICVHNTSSALWKDIKCHDARFILF